MVNEKKNYDYLMFIENDDDINSIQFNNLIKSFFFFFVFYTHFLYIHIITILFDIEFYFIICNYSILECFNRVNSLITNRTNKSIASISDNISI